MLERVINWLGGEGGKEIMNLNLFPSQKLTTLAD